MPGRKVREDTLGSMIREARVKRAWNMRELARVTNISVSHICDMELNRRRPSEDRLRDICKVLKLDFEQAAARGCVLGDEFMLYLESNPSAVRLLRLLVKRKYKYCGDILERLNRK